MRKISTQVEISAPASKIWAMLTALGNFSDWNPLIEAAEGEVKAGSRLSVCICVDLTDPDNLCYQIMTVGEKLQTGMKQMDKKVIIFFSLFTLIMIGGSFAPSLWLLHNGMNVGPFGQAGMIEWESEQVVTCNDNTNPIRSV